MSIIYNKENIISDLSKLGVSHGDVILMHSSYKALGSIDGGAKSFFEAFLELLGVDGTLILPALSFDNVTRDNPFFDLNNTPSCIGYLPEYFRTEVPGVIRSIHATHSCCAIGKAAEIICKGHDLDNTPVGKNSPFAKLPEFSGKILMLGCSTDSNTSMHGVEETIKLPYGIDYENPVEYTLNVNEKVIKQNAYRHNFRVGGKHIDQRYGRIIDLLDSNEVSFGKVLEADSVLMLAGAVWDKGRKKLLEDPYYFVDYPNCER